MTRRMLSIWLPRLAIERWQRRRQEQGYAQDKSPLAALVETGPRGTLVTDATPPARAFGIAPGMRLTDARAVCPALGAVQHDREGDAKMLEEMADAMLRFTPWVALDGPDGLMLDVTGCAHLQGGEAALVETVRAVFARAGYEARTGLAGTTGAAWAAAHFMPAPGAVIPPGGETAALAPLPVAALRLTPELIASLGTLGLKTAGQLRALDRASLTRRFPPGKDHPGVVTRLDQALGLRDEPLSPRIEAPDYRVRVTPAEPLIDLDGIRHHFEQLLTSLLTLLASDARGARRLTLHAFRCDGPTERITVGLARATRTRPHIIRLFAEQFDRIDPGFGVDTLLLSAEVTEPVKAAQPALEHAHTAASPDALARLIDRISNRTGPESIHALAPVATHAPERAVKKRTAEATINKAVEHAEFDTISLQNSSASPTVVNPPLTIRGRKIKGGWEGIDLSSVLPCTGPSSGDWPAMPLRPLTLFARPEPVAVMAEIPEGPPLTFRWRRVLHRVTRASGPERLAPEWWRDLAEKTRPRDYYTIEDTSGGRYWLFRDGLYHEAHRRGDPEWFLHGVFA